MAEIKLKKRYKYAGDIFSKLIDIKFDVETATDFLNDIKDADVVEVKHGEWIQLDECANEGVYCSICHKKVYKIEYANQALKSAYCPNCGAKMDGGAK